MLSWSTCGVFLGGHVCLELWSKIRARNKHFSLQGIGASNHTNQEGCVEQGQWTENKTLGLFLGSGRGATAERGVRQVRGKAGCGCQVSTPLSPELCVPAMLFGCCPCFVYPPPVSESPEVGGVGGGGAKHVDLEATLLHTYLRRSINGGACLPEF